MEHILSFEHQGKTQELYKASGIYQVFERGVFKHYVTEKILKSRLKHKVWKKL